MACPIHIWVPIAGAVVPFAAVARERLSAFTGRHRKTYTPPSRTDVQRWAPVAATAEAQTPDEAGRDSTGR
ncbi:MAG: hypothetical protein WD734_03970 [Dehalococcoidia bacterium]